MQRAVGYHLNHLEQLFRFKRLHHINDGAHVLASLEVLRDATRGKEDHGNLFQAFLALDQIAEVVAGNLRHHHIQNQRGGYYLAQYLERLSAAGRCLHHITVPCEQCLDNTKDSRIVVHGQDDWT